MTNSEHGPAEGGIQKRGIAAANVEVKKAKMDLSLRNSIFDILLS